MIRSIYNDEVVYSNAIVSHQVSYYEYNTTRYILQHTQARSIKSTTAVRSSIRKTNKYGYVLCCLYLPGIYYLNHTRTMVGYAGRILHSYLRREISRKLSGIFENSVVNLIELFDIIVLISVPKTVPKSVRYSIYFR